MRHLEIRDLGLQKEVAEGRVEVNKVIGSTNAAGLMSKYLTLSLISERLKRMNLRLIIGSHTHHDCRDRFPADPERLP